MLNVLTRMAENRHEELVFCSDVDSGSKGVIAIHDTTLGPALGGTRIRSYKSEEEALIDVLRLSKAMTYKNSAAGLNLGGGKAVIIADPVKDKTEALLHAYGRFVQSLNGKFIAGEDMGSCMEDMVIIRKETKWVVGLPSSVGGSGDPSPLTAFGVFKGMQVCAKEVFGTKSLEGKVVAIQGLGHVGYHIAELLHKEGAKLICCEPVNMEAVKKARDELGATIVGVDDIYDVKCDIFGPFAIGATLNDKTIPRLKCKIVAGSANNQLAVEERDGMALSERGILYAPDYIINAGGVIDVAMGMEPGGYNAEASRAKTAKIYDTMTHVLEIAKLENILPYKAANRLAEARVEKAKGGK